MPRDPKASQANELVEQREPVARDLDERENEFEYDRLDDAEDRDDDDNDDDDDDDDDGDAALSDAPKVDDVEEDATSADAEAFRTMSLLDIEREFVVEEGDITEEIDLDLLPPADDGYEAEYA